MLNRVIKTITKYPFMILITVTIVIVLVLSLWIGMRLSPNRINLNNFNLNNNLKLEITNIYSKNGYVYIEGYSYDTNSLEEYINYISGSGNGYRVDNTLFIEHDNEYYSILTTPQFFSNLYDENGNTIGYSGFVSRIDIDSIGSQFRLGVLTDEDEYIILSEYYSYE